MRSWRSCAGELLLSSSLGQAASNAEAAVAATHLFTSVLCIMSQAAGARPSAAASHPHGSAA